MAANHQFIPPVVNLAAVFMSVSASNSAVTSDWASNALRVGRPRMEEVR